MSVKIRYYSIYNSESATDIHILVSNSTCELGRLRSYSYPKKDNREQWIGCASFHGQCIWKMHSLFANIQNDTSDVESNFLTSAPNQDACIRCAIRAAEELYGFERTRPSSRQLGKV